MNAPRNPSEPKPGSSEGNGPRIRVAIVYQILHHFRDPIFSRLVGRGDTHPRYRLFASAKNDIDSNETIDPARAERPIEDGGLPWTFVRNHPLGGPFLWQSGVLSVAMSRQNDVIIFLGNMYFLSTWVALAIARMRGKRVLFWGHGYRRQEANLKGRMREMFYSMGHGALLYGERAKGLLEQRGFDHDDLYVVYNSLDYARQRSIRDATDPGALTALRDRLFGAPDVPVLVCIGRLESRKRLDVLIDTLRILDERGLRVNLLLVGDGEARDALEQHAQTHGLTGRVHFYGACYEEAEIGPLLMSSELCVCPGPIGLTAIHAMAYGVPVLSHDDFEDQGPEVEAIVPGETGALYRSGDFEDLTRKIENWIREHPTREDVAARCIAQIENRYNADRQAMVIDAAVRGTPASAVETAVSAGRNP